MSCQVLTQSRLDALLSGRLDASVLPELQKHFEAPCEQCFERLSGVDAEQLLLALAPTAELSAEEQRAVFEKAISPRAERRAVVEVKPRGFRWLGWAIAAATALLAIGVWVPNRQAGYDGIKGTQGPLKIELRAFVAAPGGEGRPLTGKIHAGEAVFFRVALEQPAHFYLYAIAGETIQVLWQPDANEAAWPAGERELAEGGKALGFDPARLGPDVSVVGIASPERFEKLDPLSVSKQCPRCAVQRLEIGVQ